MIQVKGKGEMRVWFLEARPRLASGDIATVGI
jgi:hypothetical protein